VIYWPPFWNKVYAEKANGSVPLISKRDWIELLLFKK